MLTAGSRFFLLLGAVTLVSAQSQSQLPLGVETVVAQASDSCRDAINASVAGRPDNCQIDTSKELAVALETACTKDCTEYRANALKAVKEACKDDDNPSVKSLVSFNELAFDSLSAPQCSRDANGNWCLVELQAATGDTRSSFWCGDCGQRIAQAQKTSIELIRELPKEGPLGALVQQLLAQADERVMKPAEEAMALCEAAEANTAGAGNLAIGLTASVTVALVAVINLL